jgi:hypothetical protein
MKKRMCRWCYINEAEDGDLCFSCADQYSELGHKETGDNNE